MKILVIGSSGNIGSAVVGALEGRHEVVSGTRSSVPPVDATDPESVATWLQSTGPYDAIITCLGSVAFKPLGELSREDYSAGFSNKVLSQVDVVRLGTKHLNDGGSFTLTTGILAREPIASGAAAAMANGALESFVAAAATELPRGIRINAVSPTVMAEATGYHAMFPGFVPVPASTVAAAYVKSVEGVQTGRVFIVE